MPLPPTTADSSQMGDSRPPPCSAFGLYRPDGSLFRVSLSTELSEGQEDNIMSNAWREIQPEDDFRAGIPRPDAENAAKAAGWRVIPVTILPNS